ncbi:MAG TPA: sugar ABC transporter substrate-binding protein, partial [Herpetosiphonaceae bacterium]|nr:sugar ABC transporter substrate-binding protein [Herpetosiphonaceae bacterium]
MIRRTSATLLVLIMGVSLILAACGSNEATLAPTSAGTGSGGAADPAGLSGEITVWAWNIAAKSLEATVASFNKKHPNVKVNVQDIGRTDVYDKLTTGLQGGGAGLPDVVAIESDRMDVYTAAFPDGLADLTARASKYEADFDPSKWAQSKKDGKIRSIPWDSGPTGLWYRVDFFQQAGVDPQSIETWDDLIAAGEKINAATGGKVKLLPVDIVADDAGFRMMTSQLGLCCYFNPDGAINLTDPRSVKAMATLKAINDKGLIANINGWDGVVGATKNGDVATVPFGVWYSGTIIDQAPDLSGKWDVMLLPAFEKGGNRAANLGGSTLAIPAASKNQDAAWAFVENALATSEGQNIMMEKFGIWPSYLPAYKADFYNQPVAFFNNQPIWKLFAGEVSQIPAATYTKDYAKGQAVLASAQAKVMTQGADPAAALEEA